MEKAKMKIGDKVAWKNRHGIQVGRIVRFEKGDIIGTTNWPGLHRQQNAIIDVDGVEKTVDIEFLTQKNSGVNIKELESY